MTRALVKQMLDALTEAVTYDIYQRDNRRGYECCEAAITAAREYLAAPEQSEPLIWINSDDDVEYSLKPWMMKGDWVPLYTHQAPQPTELTDDEIWAIWDDFYATTQSYNHPPFEIALYRNIIAAQKAKV
jgi:hypothetical protein